MKLPSRVGPSLVRWAITATVPFGALVVGSAAVHGAPAKPPAKAKASASVSASPSTSASIAAPLGPKPLAETLTGAAKDDYDTAMTAYSLKDYAGASIKFRAAYDKAKDARLLFNLASCEKNLRHYVKMRALLRQYLAEGGALLVAKDREDAEALIAAIEPFISALEIKVDPPGAQVFVDDELVGTTPLEKPIAVDLGTRKVHVHKDGFKDGDATVVVGGDKNSVVELKLAIVVVGANLEIHAPADAHIYVDNREVGVGTWKGKLDGGGHSLRVSAPGMLTRQVEVVLQDGVDRSIDVVLDPAAPQAEPTGPDFALSLRAGYGNVHRGGGAALSALWFDSGVYLSRVVMLGGYAQLGNLSTSNACATSAHGPTANAANDLDVRYSFDRCTFFKTGLEVMVHTLPRGTFDPWFALDFGIAVQNGPARTFDPLGAAGTDTVRTTMLQPGLQLGLDWHLFQSYRPLTLGAFVATSGILFGTDRFERQPDTPTSNNDGNKTKLGLGTSDLGITFLAGLRAGWSF